jgi:hypothetical protein
MNKYKLLLPALTLITLTFSACEKEAGEGGTSTIRGKVKTQHIAGPGSIDSTYYLADERIYIIYGNDDDTYDDDMRTSFDGSYEFKYLQKGTYRIFAYSVDTTGWSDFTFDITRPPVAVIATVEITDKKQTIHVPDIEVFTWQ